VTWRQQKTADKYYKESRSLREEVAVLTKQNEEAVVAKEQLEKRLYSKVMSISAVQIICL
jgi:hypothetical protein